MGLAGNCGNRGRFLSRINTVRMNAEPMLCRWYVRLMLRVGQSVTPRMG